jgi:hypothetical protein
MGMLRQSHLGQGTGKAKAVQKTEAEGNEPRQARGQTWHTTPCIQDLDRNQHDAERYGGFHRRTRHVDQAQCLRRKRNAMRDGERGHSDRDATPLANQYHERQYKQKMIKAEQDVLDAKPQISRSDFSCARRGLDHE